MSTPDYPTIQFTPVAWRVSREGGWTVYDNADDAQLDFEAQRSATLEPLFAFSYPPQPDEAREGSQSPDDGRAPGITPNPSFSKAEGRTP